MKNGMNRLNGVDVKDKTVLCRLDINSPLDPVSKKIINDNRIQKSLPTLEYLLSNGAKVVVIAHQGDTLDYQNLIPLKEHAEILTKLTGKSIGYVDDVCGGEAIRHVANLQSGEAVILGNLRYLCEELSTFEKDVKLTPKQMCNTWLVRALAPVCDLYVNDAFAAAHRNAPSMVAFQQLLPSFAGFLLYDEYEALSKVRDGVQKPSVFVLGGAKISDAFGMMSTVLENGTAEYILTTGVTGVVMLAASGKDIGETARDFLAKRDLLGFIDDAKSLIDGYKDQIKMPVDVAVIEKSRRVEIDVDKMPRESTYPDIGQKTIQLYRDILMRAGTIFANGPAGVYEEEMTEVGTREIWKAVAQSPAFSVIGGGDTIASASRYIDLKDISYVCTAGGAMVRFMSGKTLPLISAMLSIQDGSETVFEM